VIAEFVGPSFHESSMSVIVVRLPAFGKSGLELGHRLVDCEGRSILAGWELLERFQELSNKR
jgi:hypothetical protein